MTPSLPEPAEPDDQTVVAAVLAGDVDAFERLMRRHQRAVHAFVRVHAPSPSQADDLTQAAFVTAFERLERYDAGQPFRPWLFGIARNLVRRAWEHAARDGRRRAALEARAEREATLASAARCTGDESAARLEALAACMAELPERRARIVGWRYGDGWTLERIAEALGNSASSVGVTLKRVRDRLRECVARRLGSAS